MINHVKLDQCHCYMIRIFNTELIMVVNYFLEKGQPLPITFSLESVFQEGEKWV